MSIDYFTPETFDKDEFGKVYVVPAPPAAWWLAPLLDEPRYRQFKKPVSYSDGQFLVPQCMTALAGEGKTSRRNVERLIFKLRGYADKVDPAVEQGIKCGIPDPNIGWDMNPNLCAAEAERLRDMADYLEDRLGNYPVVDEGEEDLSFIVDRTLEIDVDMLTSLDADTSMIVGTITLENNTDLNIYHEDLS